MYTVIIRHRTKGRSVSEEYDSLEAAIKKAKEIAEGWKGYHRRFGIMDRKWFQIYRHDKNGDYILQSVYILDPNGEVIEFPDNYIIYTNRQNRREG